MPKIYHIVSRDTFTFLTKEDYDRACSEGMYDAEEDVACTSDISDEDYRRLSELLDEDDENDGPDEED